MSKKSESPIKIAIIAGIFSIIAAIVTAYFTGYFNKSAQPSTHPIIENSTLIQANDSATVSQIQQNISGSASVANEIVTNKTINNYSSKTLESNPHQKTNRQVPKESNHITFVNQGANNGTQAAYVEKMEIHAPLQRKMTNEDKIWLVNRIDQLLRDNKKDRNTCVIVYSKNPDAESAVLADEVFRVLQPIGYNLSAETHINGEFLFGFDVVFDESLAGKECVYVKVGLSPRK